jgi:hypothetical protein
MLKKQSEMEQELLDYIGQTNNKDFLALYNSLISPEVKYEDVDWELTK